MKLRVRVERIFCLLKQKYHRFLRLALNRIDEGDGIGRIEKLAMYVAGRTLERRKKNKTERMG